MADNNAFAKVIAKSWSDDAFRARLLENPNATLAEEGVPAPEGVQYAVVENSDTVSYLVLPARPSELSDEQLDSVAGGWDFTICGTREGGYSV